MLSVSCPWSLLSFRRLRREAFVQPEPIVVTGRAQFAALKMVSDAENSPSGPALSREIERQLVVVKVVALGVARIEDVVNENAGVKGFASAAAIPHFAEDDHLFRQHDLDRHAFWKLHCDLQA